MSGAESRSWLDELPLVGRRGDLQALRLLLDGAVDGMGHTLFLTGEAGIGKSRLLDVLAAEARGRDAILGYGSASAIESNVPYGVVADARSAPFRALDPATLATLTRGVAGDLRAIIPAIPDPRGGLEPAASDPDVKGRMLWNFAQFLVRLSARSPLLLVLENGQWFDPSSARLVHFLARQIAGARILVVVSYVSDETDPGSPLRSAERSLEARREATTRRLLPLTLRDTQELLLRMVGHPAPWIEHRAAAFHRRTGGNPFFLRELLRTLAEHFGDRAEGWGGVDVERLPLPASVHEVVRERLAALGEPAQRVVAAAVVIGTRSSPLLLEHASTLPPDDFLGAIDLLRARGVLVEQADDEGGHYRFAHPIVQASVREGISAARGRMLHAAVADAPERMHGAHAPSSTIPRIPGVHLISNSLLECWLFRPSWTRDQPRAGRRGGPSAA